jgi:poly[(R)-3-hydroxyalkanoate] polymerase subunit PhaC
MAVARSHLPEIVSLPRAASQSVQPKVRAFGLPPAAPDETSGTEREDHDSYSVTALADITDRSLRATLARFTGGLSPAALGSAYLDWAVHLAGAPGKRLQLLDKAIRKSIRFANYAVRCALGGGRSERCIEPLSQDRRFAGDNWQTWPFNFISQAFLLQQQWWHNATVGVRGVSKRHEDMLAFGSRQLLDTIAPSNFVFTNPEILERTISTGGLNLVKGMQHFVEDWERAVSGKKPIGTERFVVGKDVAITPGKVVYRNGLIELIQYAPATENVSPEPILIIPAWIMKYYILDLSPQNSLVKYLTEQGFTVFMISWKNPGPEDRSLTLEDYRSSGILAAFEVINSIVPKRKIHAVGYCLGGTLLSVAAAAMARDGDDRLASVTLLAAQTDFTEAGELTLFIDESQLSFLEDMMWEQGFLDSRQMAGAFHMLRSNDLIWSHMINDYLLGERQVMTDLMAWNTDATRMPYRMHSDYLRKLFLDNDLAEGRFVAGGKPVSLTDIRLPIFAVGTERDHVAPWRSTYKINLQTETEVTYLLTTGGHNVGIVSEMGYTGSRSFRVRKHGSKDHYIDPDRFLIEARQIKGSWWPEWVSWLETHSGPITAPPRMGAAEAGLPALGEAPGSYVLRQ